MGKKIDCFVLTVAVALGFYVYFQRSFRNRVVSLLLAVLCCILIRKTLKNFRHLVGKSAFIRKQDMRRRAGSAVMQIACMETSEACKRMGALLEAAYGNSYNIDVIQFPASARLSQVALFEHWKKHRGIDRIVLCATCSCDEDCRNLAASLRMPKVVLLDADNIASLIAEHPEGFTLQEKQIGKKLPLQLKKTVALLLNRRNAPRCLLFAASTFGIYLLNGNRFYLLSSLALFCTALISLRRTPKPAKLF